MKKCGQALAGRTERGRTKSGRVLDEVMEGRVGFLIWIEVGGSPPISLASWLQDCREKWGCTPLPLHRSTKTDLCELQEFFVVPSGEMLLVLRKEAFIQEMKKGINRGAAGVGGRRRSVRSKDLQEVFRQQRVQRSGKQL